MSLDDSCGLDTGTILTNSQTQQKYTVLSQLGKGGFGLTYLCERSIYNSALGEQQKVVIKELYFQQYCTREDLNVTIGTDLGRQAFISLKRGLINEARFQFQLIHPYLVRVYDLFEANNTVYLVMQFIDGHDLKQLIVQNKKISYENVLRYARQIGEAIRYIHSNKIIHHDIKPSNIIIDKNNNVKLIDFGFSNSYDQNGIAEESRLLRAESGMYSAPETLGAEGKLKFNPAADIYSLGITLYHAMGGQQNYDAFTRATIADPTLKLPEPDDRAIEQFINKCCSIKPTDRFQNADDFLFALSALDVVYYSDSTAIPASIKETRPAVKENKKGHIIFYGISVLIALFFVWYLYDTEKVFAGNQTKIVEILPADEITKQRNEDLDNRIKLFKDDVLNSITNKNDSERIISIEKKVYGINDKDVEDTLVTLNPQELEVINTFAELLVHQAVWDPCTDTINYIPLFNKAKQLSMKENKYKAVCADFVSKWIGACSKKD